ncbi:hypothetical protein AVEN_23853-1 [Araneus ventricosus]|uniref:Uncharacterized protein n=1 Tax=Araneus ventricosus TaxID=182803 RepID=A0A4Y2QBT8_ARAVE|nr:hypothetical protein AVEN_23853-1 [Araneus ventricosus]
MRRRNPNVGNEGLEYIGKGGWRGKRRAESGMKNGIKAKYNSKPAGVASPKLSRILLQKGAVSNPLAWLKKFEPTVTQNPMTIKRLFIVDYSDCEIFR